MARTHVNSESNRAPSLRSVHVYGPLPFKQSAWNIIRQNRFSYQWICTRHATFYSNVRALHCMASSRYALWCAILTNFEVRFLVRSNLPIRLTFLCIFIDASTQNQFSRHILVVEAMFLFFWILFSLGAAAPPKCREYNRPWTNSHKCCAPSRGQNSTQKSKPEHEIGERVKWRQNKCASNVAQAHTGSTHTIRVILHSRSLHFAHAHTIPT